MALNKKDPKEIEASVLRLDELTIKQSNKEEAEQLKQLARKQEDILRTGGLFCIDYKGNNHIYYINIPERYFTHVKNIRINSF